MLARYSWKKPGVNWSNLGRRSLTRPRSDGHYSDLPPTVPPSRLPPTVPPTLLWAKQPASEHGFCHYCSIPEECGIPRLGIHPGAGEGHWPRKGVWGCATLMWPPYHASPVVHKGPISSKSQFTRPLLKRNSSLYSLNFCPNFSSQAFKLRHFQFTSPQIWKFLVHKPPLSDAKISSQAHTSEMRAAHPYLKKSWVPPEGSHPFICWMHRIYHNRYSSTYWLQESNVKCWCNNGSGSRGSHTVNAPGLLKYDLDGDVPLRLEK